jgi:hypothetical protein
MWQWLIKLINFCKNLTEIQLLWNVLAKKEEYRVRSKFNDNIVDIEKGMQLRFGNKNKNFQSRNFLLWKKKRFWKSIKALN